jgi:hypothetical protein
MYSNFSTIPHTTIIPIKTSPFYVSQASSGTVCLSTNLSNLSLGTVGSTYLDPFSIGGRFFNFAAYFLQYRVRKGAYFQYSPYNSVTGQQEIVSGPTATPSLALRDVAWFVSGDPILALSSWAQIVDSGGVEFLTSQRRRIRIPSSGWKWCTATAATPTNIDVRTTSFGCLQMRFRQNSSTTTSTYGQIEFVGNVEFRYPITPVAIIGSERRDSEDDEKKFVVVKKA